jgi:DNA-binding CsgD family transcriptional regulator
MATMVSAESTNPTRLSGAAMAAFDWLTTGVLITRPSGQLLFANESAKHILQSQDGLSVNDSGQVATALAENPFMKLAAHFKSTPACDRSDTRVMVSISRPSGKAPLMLTMFVARQQSGWAADGEQEALFVMIHDPELSLQVGHAELRELYELTLAEARIANLIMQGKTVEECSRLLGIRRSTVRMHLRNLYWKTGVQRQCELVTLMFRSFGPIRSNRRILAGSQRVQLPKGIIC